MTRRLFLASLLFAAPLFSKDPPVNTAVVPVPKLENDCYDWWQRHEAVLAKEQSAILFTPEHYRDGALEISLTG